MNEMISKLLLARDNFMPEMHSRIIKLPRFTYKSCRPFTKKKQRNLKKQEIQYTLITTN